MSVVISLDFEEHVFIPQASVAKYKGCSILRDCPFIKEKYEVLEPNDDIYRFETDEQLDRYLSTL